MTLPAPTSLGVRSIAVVRLHGYLAKQTMHEVRSQIRASAVDPSVKGIFISVESPAGDFYGGYELNEEIREAAIRKKPVHSHITDIAGNSAYWVIASSTTISANQPAYVGNLGTAAAITDASQAATKQGLQVHVIRAGALKGMGTPGTEVTTQQLAHLQSLVDSRNTMIFEAVAKGRRMTLEKVRQVADGRLYAAREALALGLIDKISTFENAFREFQK